MLQWFDSNKNEYLFIHFKCNFLNHFCIKWHFSCAHMKAENLWLFKLSLLDGISGPYYWIYWLLKEGPGLSTHPVYSNSWPLMKANWIDLSDLVIELQHMLQDLEAHREMGVIARVTLSRLSSLINHFEIENMTLIDLILQISFDSPCMAHMVSTNNWRLHTVISFW